MNVRYSPNFLLLVFLLFCIHSCKNNPTIVEEPIGIGLKNSGSFPIGGAVNINKVLADEKLKKISEDNFNSITATNDMKMYSIASEEGQYNWQKVDSLIAFCDRNDSRLFGHTLIWHYGIPQWIKQKTEEEGDDWVKEFMSNYIKTVVGRYKGKVAAWDVVNEAFSSAGGSFRETFWREKLGPDYIENAFYQAHEVDPDAKLFYNDFNIERDTAKLKGVLRMVEDFQERGVPIHGIGFQMHIRMDTDEEVIAESLRKAAATGLLVHISELDIIFNSHNDSNGGGVQNIKEMTPELLQAQAGKYKRLVQIYRAEVPENQQYGITFWDFTDRDTWIKSFFKIEDWPTIFDEKLEPKPAYFGFKEGLEMEM